MNRGRWKQFWTWCQQTLGAGWIHLHLQHHDVYGLEHITAAARERPILLVANHRSFFDCLACLDCSGSGKRAGETIGSSQSGAVFFIRVH